MKGSKSMLAGDDCRAAVTFHMYKSALFAHSDNPVGEAGFFQKLISIFAKLVCVG